MLIIASNEQNFKRLLNFANEVGYTEDHKVQLSLITESGLETIKIESASDAYTVDIPCTSVSLIIFNYGPSERPAIFGQYRSEKVNERIIYEVSNSTKKCFPFAIPKWESKL